MMVLIRLMLPSVSFRLFDYKNLTSLANTMFLDILTVVLTSKNEKIFIGKRCIK